MERFEEEADYHFISAQSLIHHVWSQFTELKYDNWGMHVTTNTEFIKSDDTPESDVVEFESWLNNFINTNGSFSAYPYVSKYTKCNGYSPVNMQARYLTSHRKNPHLVQDDDTFEPSEVDIIESYKKHDWIAINEFFHESLCLLYYRFSINYPNDIIQSYLDDKCTCIVMQESLVSVHVTHHAGGYRSSMLDLSPNIREIIMKLTKIDTVIFKHILQDFIKILFGLSLNITLVAEFCTMKS